MATLAYYVDRPVPTREEEQHGLGLTYHRLMLVLLLFAGVTGLIVLRLAYLQAFTDRSGAAALANPLIPPRADIVDRNGIALARTIDAWSIGVHPRRVIGDREALADRLAELMPERSAAQYRAMLATGSNYLYLSRRAVPELVAAVNALGEPGIVFNREPQRLYPQTALAGHVLGWTDFDGHGVAGVERVLEDRLVDPGLRGQPVALSIDSRVQSAMESELASAVTALNAEGGTGIVLDVRTGEVIAMASAPTFNPNAAGNSDPNALFNRATMGVYELGSAFKPITVAAAMEAGVITSMSQRWDATAPIPIGRFRISDDHAPEPDAERPGTAGPFVQHRHRPDRRCDGRRAHAGRLSRPRLRPAGRRSSCASAAAPCGRATGAAPPCMTSGFGHGIAITPLHLASAYAALVNGGIWRPATLMQGRAGPGPARAARLFRADQPPDAPAAAADRAPTAPAATPTPRASASAARPAPPRKSRQSAAISRSVERFDLRGGFSDGSAALCGAGHDGRAQGQCRDASGRPPPPGPPRRSWPA